MFVIKIFFKKPLPLPDNLKTARLLLEENSIPNVNRKFHHMQHPKFLASYF